MREILPLLRSTSLFTGLTEEETESLLSALHGEMRAFDREELLLRAGQPVRAFGVLLSGGAGAAGGFLGQPEHPVLSASGGLFCRDFRLSARRGAERGCSGQPTLRGAVSGNAGAFDRRSFRPCGRSAVFTEFSGESGGKKSPAEREDHSHGPAQHPGEGPFLLIGLRTAAGRCGI